MDATDFIIESAISFYNDLQNDVNGRYKSWEHCYTIFTQTRRKTEVDLDYLSLHLAFYLASWGMYRGSAFLLQKDYKVHIPVVREILKIEYDCLSGIECAEYREKANQDALMKLEKFMISYYEQIRKSVKEKAVKSDVSSTLITKILMGTLGCVPAYDRYFIDGIRKHKIATGTYNLKSLLMLVDFYEQHKEKLESARKTMRVYDLPYPQMKLLDMGFWQIGFDADQSTGLNVAH